MDSTTPETSASTTSSIPAGRLAPRPPVTTLAGLIDVLDRVDGPAGTSRRRLPAHRSAAPGGSARPAGLRPHGFRATATRSMPLRSVQPAPMARPPVAAPAAAALAVEPGSYWDMTRPPAPAAPIQVPAQSRMATLIRRAAMWGAGPHGENLAWRTSMAPPAAQPPAATAPRGPEASRPREPRLSGLVRRMALWGAGEGGANLAWRPRVRPEPARRLDPPVVLREMPSTPTIQPAATSPAAALVPAAPAIAVRRPIGPVLPRVAGAGWVAPVGWVAPIDSDRTSPAGWPAAPTGWPQPPEWPPAKRAATAPAPAAAQVPTSSGRAAHSAPGYPAARFPFPSPRERGLARARGDPLSSPSRGSPPRRPFTPTPSATIWSPAASLPAPRPAPTAPG